jgi:site-specific DNA-methyltransferase (adenine-specific)
MHPPVASELATPAAPNLLVHGDALHLLRHVAPGTADTAYLDPPFKVERNFGARLEKGRCRADGPIAYEDTWDSLEAYLGWLEERLRAVWELLSPQGTLWLHLDQRAVHEAKVSCDRVFGPHRFRGEVIWVPGNGSKSRSGPGIGHQTLLLYARGKEPLWNARDSALREPFAATSLEMHFTHVDDAGRKYRERIVRGKSYRYYADEGRALGSVWTDCPSMAANTPLCAESTGYPTQKPLKLLDRIVRATSAPGSLIVDPCCGSGTTLVASAQAGRRFAGSDVGALAIDTTRARLAKHEITYAFQANDP